MMIDPTQPRRRRGRPPMAQPAPEQPEAEPTAKPTRRRARQSVNGQSLKLAVPDKPGFHRHWFVDKPGRLELASDLAYTHVEDGSIKSDGTDSRVRRLTGTDRQGAPQYSYLMETPLEEYQAGIDEKEEAHAAFEQSIIRGQDPEGQLQNAYGRGSIGAD